MQFIVYRATAEIAGGLHEVLRWGVASEESVPDQAGPGQVASGFDGIIPDLEPRARLLFDPAERTLWVQTDEAASAADRAMAVGRINAAAGFARQAWITATPGQEMIYKAKLDEARAFLSGPEPDSLAAFPLLAAEVGITAPDARQIALIWSFMADHWIAAAAQIEAARLAGIGAVQSAQTLSQIEAAAESARAALAQITPGAAKQEEQA